MQHKKLMALLALVLTALVVFTACGEEKTAKKENVPDELSGKIKVIAQEGAAGLNVLRVMGENYQIKTYKRIGDVRTAIKDGKYDAAILSAGIAAEMYDRTDKGLLEVSPVSLRGVYVVASGYGENGFRPSMMMGKKVICMDKNSTADQVWQKVMYDSGASTSAVRIRYVNNFEAMQKAFGEWGMMVICTEPYAGKLDKISEVNKVFDLSEEYESYGYGPVPADVLVVSRDMAKNRRDDVRLMKNEYEEALDTVKKGKTKLVFYNQSDRGIKIMRDYNNTVGNEASYFKY